MKSLPKLLLIILIIILAVLILILIQSQSIYKKHKYPSTTIDNMNYIELIDSGEIIQLSKVKTMGPALWKGSVKGILYYNDGSSVQVKVSMYGDFFGIVDEMPTSFYDGVLYHYNYDE